MKHLLFCLAAFITVTSCGGSQKPAAGQADSGQTHVGNSNPADSNNYPVSPTEAGGKDTSGNGIGTTNAPKDTLKTNP